MGLKENIKSRRQQLSLTLEDAANYIGVSKPTLQRYESGVISNIPAENIEKLAEVLRCSPAYLMGWDKNVTPKDEILSPYEISTKKLPLVKTEVIKNKVHQNIENYILTNKDDNSDFCIKIMDESISRIENGDLVFIQRQDDVEDGEIALVIIDNVPTLRRVYKLSGRVQLRAENSKYKPLDFNSEDVKSLKILGKATAFQRELR